MKSCPGCKLELSDEKFGRDRAKKDGLQWRCRICLSEYSKQRYRENPEFFRATSRRWHQENPEKVKRAQKKADLRREYGISLREFEEMIARQKGECAICEDRLLSGKNGSHVDHDHKTGKVREILCGSCNIGLGHFKDSPIRLRTAADYLEKYFS